MEKHKNWYFIDFKNINWNEVYKKNKQNIKYILWGPEINFEKKKYHQGWIQFANPLNSTKIKYLCDCEELKLNSCNINPKDIQKFYKKTSGYKIKGKFIYQDHRTKIERMKKAILEGFTKNFLIHNFSLKYYNIFHDFIIDVKKKIIPLKRNVKVIYITGSIKQRNKLYAIKKNTKDLFIIKGNDIKNGWDEYDGEKKLLIEEYNNNINISYLKNILDIWRCKLDCKNNFTYSEWTDVTIISKLTKDELHSNDAKIFRDGLFRRINKIINC